MAINPINVGTAPNDGTGDPIRSAFQKVNANDQDLQDQLSNLATVATSGSYNDLSDTPTLGTAAAAATGDFATAAQGAKADTAVQPAAIADFVEGDGITNIVALTQAAYDLLTPDASTLYVIIPEA